MRSCRKRGYIKHCRSKKSGKFRVCRYRSKKRPYSMAEMK